MDLVEKIESNIAEHRLLEPGERVMVGVSGGVDSVVLLHILKELSADRGWEISVAHFNHQLRGRASEVDEQFVANLASKMGLRFQSDREDVRKQAQLRGVSIEMAARSARHAFFARTAREGGIGKCALGHHADDQVELFLLRLLRGTAGEALTGMKWKGPSSAAAELILIRPFLNVSREEILAFATEKKIPYQHDETNDQMDYERNRIRHKLIPFLKENFAQNLERSVARIAQVIADEKEFIKSYAKEVRAAKRKFEDLPVAVQRQLLHAGLLEAGLTPEFELVERLRKDPGTQIMVAPDVVVRRTITGAVEKQKHTLKSFRAEALAMKITGAGHAEFNGVEFSWEQLSPPPGLKKRPQVEVFDANKIGSTITLRHWRPGDRFQPIGMEKSVKLQDLFINAHVPWNARRDTIVGEAESGEIFWVEGLRISELFKIGPETRSGLEWRWNRAIPLAD